MPDSSGHLFKNNCRAQRLILVFSPPFSPSPLKRKRLLSVPGAEQFEDGWYSVYNQDHQIFIRPTADMFYCRKVRSGFINETHNLTKHWEAVFMTFIHSVFVKPYRLSCNLIAHFPGCNIYMQCHFLLHITLKLPPESIFILRTMTLYLPYSYSMQQLCL